MKDYWICSKSQVADRTSKHGITHVLSMLDPYERPFLHPNRPVVHKLMHFEDEEDPKVHNAPTKWDVEEMLRWAKELPNDAHLLVHCYAGMCRSTATALLIDIQKNMVNGDWRPHWDKLLVKRDIAIPNSLILKYGVEILGLDSGLLDHNEAYCRRMILKMQW